MGSSSAVFPRARLAVAAVLFVGWLGILLMLVLKTRDPVILSRPQLLVSNVVIVAQVQDRQGADATVTVKEILWSADTDDALAVGEAIEVQNLTGTPSGWQGAQQYILPLIKSKSATGVSYQLTPLPIVPGYHPKADPDVRDVRVYPVTADALAQWRELAAKWSR